MNQHPAHQLAETAWTPPRNSAATRTPPTPSPGNSPRTIIRAILPRLHHAIADIAVCIDGIAQATADEQAKQQLAEGVQDLLSGCSTGSKKRRGQWRAPCSGAEPEPGTMTQPAALAASSFPQPLTGQALNEAAAASAPPPASAAAVPRPGTASPGRTC